VAQGVFVTGTDTGIGKTVVAATLVRAWQADYWKPVQTGLAEETGDTDTVARLSGADPERLHRPRWLLQAPLSPEDAAAPEGVVVALEDFTLPASSRPLVVEGAGGVLVPLNRDVLMVDLMVRLGLPVVLVARSTLGTINHTLLSVEALRGRGLTLAGVILNGPPNPRNRAAIEAHGRLSVLAELPPVPIQPDADTIAGWSACLPSWSAISACA